jgi:hypothetical protein
MRPGRRFTVPAAVTELQSKLIPNAKEIEFLDFEPGSGIREIGLRSLVGFFSLRSICIPPSVEVLERLSVFEHSWEDETLLEEVRFAPGSRLRRIGSRAFRGCSRLKSFHIPSSVEIIETMAFCGPVTRSVTVDPENPHFHVRGNLLIATNERSIIYCFESNPVVTIPADIQTLEPMSFSFARSIRAVEFEHSGAESQLEFVQEGAFQNCISLESINLPSSVAFLGSQCFLGCHKLATVTFPTDSKLERIEDCAFWGCSSLKSLVVPSSLQFLGDCCFAGCDELLDFRFAWPSHLKELWDLPPRWSGLKDIPDSVEILEFLQCAKFRCEYTLNFGKESKLRKIKAHRGWSTGRAFLGVSSGCLKAIRSDLEFPVVVTDENW